MFMYMIIYDFVRYPVPSVDNQPENVCITMAPWEGA